MVMVMAPRKENKEVQAAQQASQPNGRRERAARN
jgi:hypothetical protein